MKPFTVYSDRGHGWIAVKYQFLQELDITNEITPYSFIKGKTVYLEEDKDASIFITAFKKRFNIDPTFIYKTYKKSAPIRYYERFKKDGGL